MRKADNKYYIEEADETHTLIKGYKRSIIKTIFAWIIYILTGFIVRLIINWKPQWFLRFEYVQCQVGPEMDVILCKDEYQVFWLHKVRRISLETNELNVDDHNENTPLSKETKLNTNEGYQLVVYFMHKKIKYIWNWKQSYFDKLEGLQGTKVSSLLKCSTLSNTDACRLRQLYDYNEIVIELTPILVLLVREGLNPFYVFQICSCILWFLDDYTIFASCIIVMSAISLSVQLYQTRKNQITLKETVTSHGEAFVFRRTDENDIPLNNEVSRQIDARFLVPGDVIELRRDLTNYSINFDAVLLSGNAIVNESMLTGESIPVTKTPIPPPPQQTEDDINARPVLLDIQKHLHNRHALYCGTKLVQVRHVANEPIRAVVVRTGYLTAKGGLVRSILFPRPIDARLANDAMKLVMVLAGFAAVGFIYTMVIMISRQITPWKIAVRSLDLITIVVPPALPVAMTIGVVFAQSRLKACRIFCISPSTINTCGAINVTCFDKTGTLTEDGLDLWGVIVNRPLDGTMDPVEPHPARLEPTRPIVEVMACCHSLTYINGELCGDPLDLIMFNSLGWTFHESHSQQDYVTPIGLQDDTVSAVEAAVSPPVPIVVRPPAPIDGSGKASTEIGILRQFTFSSQLQRMSVIAKVVDRAYFSVYVKGSPEVILPLCRADTVPRDFSQQLVALTKHGYRVLALASRPLKVSYPRAMKLPRALAESELRFAGLLVLENRLKPHSRSVIEELRGALIRPVMVTGDNLLTGLSVSRECGILGETEKVVIVDACSNGLELHYAGDLQWSAAVKEVVLDEARVNIVSVLEHRDFHLALTGRSWAAIREHFPYVLPKLVKKGSVFARFSPDQKAQLIEVMQSNGDFVMMCGDGANDCGALKMAHAGISLCEASSDGTSTAGTEASVASPFVSRTGDVSCVPALIKEGRCALATSFGIFRFIAAYSFTQFMSVLILYWFTANLSDFQFLYIDLVVIGTLSLTFSYTKSAKCLSEETPSIRLLSVSMILSLTCQWTINALFQILAVLYIHYQPWYFMPKPKTKDEYIHNSYNNMAIFIVSSFQYLILALVFSKGGPFRAPIYTNYLFLINVMGLFLFNVYFSFYPFPWLKSLMVLVDFPSNASIVCVLLAGILLSNLMVSKVAEWIIDVIDRRKRNTAHKLRLFGQLTHDLERDGQANPWPGRVILSQSVQDMRPEIFTDSLASLATDPQPQTNPPSMTRHQSAYEVRAQVTSRSKIDIDSIVKEEILSDDCDSL